MDRAILKWIVAPAAIFGLTSCSSLGPVAPDPPLFKQAVVENSTWVTLPTESYPGKRDDIVFVTPSLGFYGTGAGDIYKTEDGGSNWSRVWSQPGTFIRALGFIDERQGFFGNVGDVYPGVTDRHPLYATEDGGLTWSPVQIPHGIVAGICAIDVLRTKSIYQEQVRDQVIIHAAGRVSGPAALLRSTDAGHSWSVIDLTKLAGMILDVKFTDANTGFVFAGTASDIRQSEALILKTEDGGRSWREVYRSGRPLENSWKASFVTDAIGFATIQTYDPARSRQLIVRTVDGGNRWEEILLVENLKARQFGIGFLTENIGWVGTAEGGFETTDGGKSWRGVPLAPAANKIRTRTSRGDPKVYAIGTEVQHLAIQPLP
jgi:photosystem II stability/assembly factor-like uncharacterized protein